MKTLIPLTRLVARCMAATILALPQASMAEAPLTRESVAQRIQAGEIASNPLFLPDAERRIIFANTAFFAPTRRVSAGVNTRQFTQSHRDFSDVRYEVDGVTYTLEAFLALEPLMGFAVVQGDEMLLEHYASDHGPDTRWITFSVTKSVNSMLVGAAIEDGYITSIDDKVTDYLPRLKGSEYEAVTIEQILQMSSGVAWDEDYTNPESDVSVAGAANGITLTKHLATLGRAQPPGKKFNYSTGEANLVGEVLRAAIGNNASTYLSHKIWRPFGMESDASWLTDVPGGGETGGCCISATLRDYARIGLFALSDGVLEDGTRILPEGWMQASTSPSPSYPGYGYQWWLDGTGAYQASGIFGQMIAVAPDKQAVIVAHSNAPTATDSEYARHLRGVTAALKSAI